MAGRKQLRPVRTDERPAPSTMSGAVERGTRLDELKAMRRVLAAHIDSENTLARDLAPLMRQAREISSEIESLEARDAERVAMEVDNADGATDAVWRPQAI